MNTNIISSELQFIVFALANNAYGTKKQQSTVDLSKINLNTAKIAAENILDSSDSDLENKNPQRQRKQTSFVRVVMTQEQKRTQRAEAKKRKAEAKKARAKANREKKANSSQGTVIVPKTVQMKTEEIANLRFSQDSVDHKTNKGMTLDLLTENMATKGWKKGTSIAVVVMPDNILTSLDNRRVVAANKVGHSNLRLTANVFQHTDRAPKKLIAGLKGQYRSNKNGRQINLFSNQQTLEAKAPGVKIGTYGHCVILRINLQNSASNENRYGYTETPIIRQRHLGPIA